MGDEEIYGVVEMINKKGGGAFTNSDKDHFQTFSVFCALALRYANVSRLSMYSLFYPNHLSKSDSHSKMLTCLNQQELRWPVLCLKIAATSIPEQVVLLLLLLT